MGRLAQKSFLSLWSHANLYRDVSKELCDLLVVCHNTVVIFSDKEVKFDETLPLELAWPRWYNRAIHKSVSQLKRAKNWIQSHPDRIFRDARCAQPLSLFERVEEPLEIHLVAIANGASRACVRFFDGGSGSLLVDPDETNQIPGPFSVGNPGAPDLFVHVFDESHLHILLQELDTIRDFSDYLAARQKLISNKNLFMAASEEDLLATYLKDINERGEHDFVWTTGRSLQSNQQIAVVEGSYRSYRTAKLYKRKKKADVRSYMWDRLIEKFAANLTAGTLADVPEFLGQDGKHLGAELGLRYMALERRVQRRAHADAILGAFNFLEKQRGTRFFRAMIPETVEQGETGFCILLLKPEIAPEGTPYEEYRAFRAANLSAYTEGILERNRHLKRMIGIATEGMRRGAISEDLVYHEPPEWTDEAVSEAKTRADGFGIFTEHMNQTRYSASEYPKTGKGLAGKFSPIPYHFIERSVSNQRSSGNRKQRRADAARSRKRETDR